MSDGAHEIQAVNGPRHALELLDDANELINFCACHMSDVERYNRGSYAFWSVCHWIASLQPKEPTP